MRVRRLARGRASSFRPPAQAQAPEASSRNSVPFLKVAPLFRSNNQRARVSARFPAEFAGDYNGQQFRQSAHHGPSRDQSPPLGNCFSFWPPFEPGVFLTIFPLFECSIDDCQLVFIDRQSAIGNRKFILPPLIWPLRDYHAPGPTGMRSLLSPRPSRL